MAERSAFGNALYELYEDGLTRAKWGSVFDFEASAGVSVSRVLRGDRPTLALETIDILLDNLKGEEILNKEEWDKWHARLHTERAMEMVTSPPPR